MNKFMLQLNLVLKRIFDICLSGISIIVLLPVWIVVSIAIKFDSKGPIIFHRKEELRMEKFLKCINSDLWL